jgi:hypothetical protein
MQFPMTPRQLKAKVKVKVKPWKKPPNRASGTNPSQKGAADRRSPFLITPEENESLSCSGGCDLTPIRLRR